jgi:hypothetical protein
MCDYSLENKISRAADAGDKLVTCSFPMTPTRGFCAEKEPGVAVCLLPDTELAFEGPIKQSGFWGLIVDHVRARLGYEPGGATVTRFREVDLHNPHTHHDAIELADGRIIKLTMLQEGQRARVLQLPAMGEHAGHPAMARELREAVERHDRELTAVR